MLAWQALERDYQASGAIDASGAAYTKANLAKFTKANNLQVALGKEYGVTLT